jgi:hypothetical protein
MSLPTQDPFVLNIENPPHCFSIGHCLTEKDDNFYRDQIIRGDIRRYYRLIREFPHIHHLTLVGNHGITCGELAISVLRNRHHRRK